MGAHVTTIDLNATDHASPVVEGATNRIAGYLRSLRQEERLSGEGALRHFLSSSGGLTEAALGATGAGIQGMILERIGESLKEATAKAVELKGQLAEGKITAGEFGEKLAEGIPIIGAFVTAGRNIHEFFSDEARQVADINALTKERNLLMDYQLRVSHEMQHTRAEELLSLQKINEEMGRIGMTGAAKAIQALKDAHSDLVSHEDAAVKDKQTATEPEAVQKAKERLRELQAKNAPEIENNQLIIDTAMSHGGPTKGSVAAQARIKELMEQGDDALRIIKGYEELKNKAITEQQKTRDANVAADAARVNKEIAQLEKEAQYQREQDAAHHQQHMLDIAEQGRQSMLQALGQGEEAAREALKSEQEKTQADATARHTKALHDSAGNAADIAQADRQFAEESAGIASEYANKAKALAINQAMERERLEQDAQRAVVDAKAQAQAEALRLQGRGNEAELTLLNAQRDARITHIREDAKREAEAHVESSAAIMQKAAADEAAERTQSAQRIRDAQNSQAEHSASLNHSLAEARMAELRNEGKAGNTAAAAEAKRLEIQEQFNQKREALQHIIHDENATQQQKADAQKQFGGLNADEAQELAMARAGGGRGEVPLTAKFSTRGHGSFQKWLEEHPQNGELVKLQKAHKEAVDKTNMLLTELIKVASEPIGESVFGGV